MSTQSTQRTRRTRQQIHEPLTLGQRAADRVASTVGSWRFILIQNGAIVAWAILNLVAWGYHWDPYPFMFLNIIMSWQAANTGPVLQMSDNRQSEKDRVRDDLEAEEVAEIREGMTLLHHINEQQLEILTELRQRPPLVGQN